jgi:hypothetical protein
MKKIYSITEVTVISGKTSKINFDLNGKRVSIPVSAEVKARFDEQFSRSRPTQAFEKRYATLINLMRAAYLQGIKDAK